MIYDVPSYSPWGEVQNYDQLCPGVYCVSTAVTAGSWFTEALRGKFCPRQRENIVSVMAAITALKKIAMPPLLSGS